MNQATVAGHLGADPEVRFTSSGQKVTALRVAAKTRKGGKDDTIWWRMTVWGDQFDKMIAYLKKGSPIICMGEIAKPEIFTGKDGQPQISMGMTVSNLLFSPFGKSDSAGSKKKFGDDAGEERGQSDFGQGKEEEEFAEEIPF